MCVTSPLIVHYFFVIDYSLPICWEENLEKLLKLLKLGEIDTCLLRILVIKLSYKINLV